jgi:esterase/lipase superfamily enzyme
MNYYIVTNRQILLNGGSESIDTSDDGICTDNLRFAIFDSSQDNPDVYTLIPDKVEPDATQPNQPAYSGTQPYYFNPAQPVKTGSEAFFNALYSEMAAPDGGDVLVFFHGFNCSWADAIADVRAQQSLFISPAGSPIKHMVLFSWPSMGSLLRYKSDAQDASTSGLAMGRCFQLMCEFFSDAFGNPANGMKPCGRKIHLLVHSMGNQVLQTMMEKLIADGNPYQDTFEEIILAAADADFDLFEDPLAFYQLNTMCRRVHIYTNRNDLVLKFSAKYENPKKRLGTDGPISITDLPSHVYVIDCTGAVAGRDPSLENKLLQHWYYKDVPEVSNDIYAVLLGADDELIANRVNVSPVKYRLSPSL